MRALVTGANGFIGSTLIEELQTLGFDVLAFTRASSKMDNLSGLKFERLVGDFSDPESLRKAVSNIDYVFHLAGAIKAPHRQSYFDQNFEVTKRVAEATARYASGVARFVYVSSLAAAGPCLSPTPKKEIDPGLPVSAYGESKFRAETFLQGLSEALPITIIRPPLVYGPKDRALFLFVQMIERNIMPILKGSGGDGHKYYSLVHVKDLCRGMIQAAVAKTGQVPSGEVFYLSGDAVSTYEYFLSTIADTLNKTPIRFKVSPFVLEALAAAGSVLGRLTGKDFYLNKDKLNELTPDYWVCSNQKAKQILGFNPEFDLQSGIADTIEWYKRQKWL